MIPFMKTIETLLASDYLAEPELIKDLLEIHSFCVAATNQTKTIVKLLAAIGVYSHMLTFPDQALTTKALRSLLQLLYNAFPKVRQVAAEKLYTSLLMLEDYSLVIPSGEDGFDLVVNMLSETDWAQPLKVLQANKTLFYSYFGQEPKLATKS